MMSTEHLTINTQTVKQSCQFGFFKTLWISEKLLGLKIAVWNLDMTQNLHLFWIYLRNLYFDDLNEQHQAKHMTADGC